MNDKGKDLIEELYNDCGDDELASFMADSWGEDN